MTALFRPRRRAEHFDALLEGAVTDEVDRQTAELLELVGALRSVPAAEPRPEFVADLRQRLMVAAETELVAAPAAPHRDDVARLTIKPRRTHRERRVGLALGAFAIIGATTSMAVASQSAIPGDALYPLKRAIENTQTGFSVGDQAKGERILDNASGRLDEVRELTSQSDPDPKLVTQTLNTFTDQFSEAGDLLIADYHDNGNQQSIQQVHTVAADSLVTLGDLVSSIPPGAHDALLSAAETVRALDAEATQACPECGEGITEVPPQLLAAANTLGDPAGALAGGQLPGTGPSEGAGASFGVNGDGTPSGLDPPEDPVTIPSVAPTPSDGASDDSGGLLPSLGTATEGLTGGGQNGGQDNDGKGGKDKPKPVDVSPVTEPVEEVVTGVVEGVSGILGGLTGGLTGSGQ
jgi:hypothetical protein